MKHPLSSLLCPLLSTLCFLNLHTDARCGPARPSQGNIIKGGVVGVIGRVGCIRKPKKVKRLIIDSPGVYENFLVDGNFGNSILVRIAADKVILRNSEIRNSTRDGIHISGAKNVTIENCKIHHLLAGTFKNQKDAHGITGQPFDLTIRNCEIYYVSGDAVQFDPSRHPWNNVLIENCTLWTGQLPADAAQFKKGEIPGENAVDTKQSKNNPRSKITVRNCLMKGWGHGQISNGAALNIKNNVEARIEGCVFTDNEICMRLRGMGTYGESLVTVNRCAVYNSDVAVRREDNIRDLKINDLGIGNGLKKQFVTAGGLGPGFENEGEHKAPDYAMAIQVYGVGGRSATTSGTASSVPKLTDPSYRIIRHLRKIAQTGGGSHEIEPFLAHKSQRVFSEAIVALLAIDFDEGLKAIFKGAARARTLNLVLNRAIKKDKKAFVERTLPYLSSSEPDERVLAALLLNRLAYPPPVSYNPKLWRIGSQSDRNEAIRKWQDWAKKYLKP